MSSASRRAQGLKPAWFIVAQRGAKAPLFLELGFAVGANEMRPPLHELLCGFAWAFAFEGLFALFGAYVDLDLLGLGFGLLGQLNLQHAFVVARRNVVGVHGRRQSKGAGEAAILALHAAIVLFF